MKVMLENDRWTKVRDGNMKKKKIILFLLFFFILLAALILWNHKNQVEQASVLTNQKKQNQESVKRDGVMEENQKQTEVQERKKSEENVQETFLKIQHSNDYIQPVLGNWSYLVNQSLQEYCTANLLQATEADCLNCTIPVNEPKKTEFFLELQDSQKTLLQAIYNPEDRSVTIEPSAYTKEEILNEAWTTKEGPAVRDAEE